MHLVPNELPPLLGEKLVDAIAHCDGFDNWSFDHKKGWAALLKALPAEGYGIVLRHIKLRLIDIADDVRINLRTPAECVDAILDELGLKSE